MESSLETRAARLEINLDNLKHNIKELKRYIKDDTLLMATVKANAYGHGAITIAKSFLENGVDRLAVSILLEGMELRKSGIEAPILILNYTPPAHYNKIIEYDLIQNIYSYEDAKLLSKEAVKAGKNVKIHIKIDTGMARIGFLANNNAIKDIIKINKLPNIDIEGIFTHFAKSEEPDKTFTELQYSRFSWVLNELEKHNIYIPIKHVSNSGAIIEMPQYNLDMVRAGIILYGHYPSEGMDKTKLRIKPAMALKSSISNIKKLPKGSGISYNQIFTTERDSIIATLPIGYADGYTRMLTGKGQVYVEGKLAPIVGKICMDQMMVDLTGIDQASMDSEVILFDYEDGSITMEDLANKLGTVNYEIMCMMGRRLPRVYIENGRPSHIVDYLLNT